MKIIRAEALVDKLFQKHQKTFLTILRLEAVIHLLESKVRFL